MKRLLATLLLFAFVATSQAVTITYLNTNDYIGNSRDTINDNFSNMLASVNASATNAVVVTFTSMSSNWFYWVSNSADGAISYWLGCNTNSAGGAADGNTPQGPWTNWIAAATWGVSNAGTYHLADTNTILFMLGTNRLSVQGGATTPTNLDWNGSSLINPAGSGATQAIATVGSSTVTSTISGATLSWSNAAAAGGGISNIVLSSPLVGSTDGSQAWITNQFVGFMTVQGLCGTNPAISANTRTKLSFITNATSDVKLDTGSFVDAANQRWTLPVGWSHGVIDLSIGNNAANPVYGYVMLGVNGEVQTNAWGIYPAYAVSGITAVNTKQPWYVIYESENDGLPIQMHGQITIYNPNVTNLFTLIGYTDASGTIGAFNAGMTWRFLGP